MENKKFNIYTENEIIDSRIDLLTNFWLYRYTNSRNILQVLLFLSFKTNRVEKCDSSPYSSKGGGALFPLVPPTVYAHADRARTKC